MYNTIQFEDNFQKFTKYKEKCIDTQTKLLKLIDDYLKQLENLHINYLIKRRNFVKNILALPNLSEQVKNFLKYVRYNQDNNRMELPNYQEIYNIFGFKYEPLEINVVNAKLNKKIDTQMEKYSQKRLMLKNALKLDIMNNDSDCNSKEKAIWEKYSDYFMKNDSFPEDADEGELTDDYEKSCFNKHLKKYYSDSGKLANEKTILTKSISKEMDEYKQKMVVSTNYDKPLFDLNYLKNLKNSQTNQSKKYIKTQYHTSL